MKKNFASRIVLIFFILFFCLLCLSLLLLTKLNNDKQNEANSVTISTEKNPETIEEVILKYESEYIKEENNTVYVSFCKDLYNENGGSNKNFFDSLVNDLIPFFESQSFYLTDENRNITIYAKYDSETEDYTIIINNIEDFFSQTDGESYVQVEDVSITKGSNMAIDDHFLNKLQFNDGYFSAIQDELGEGKDLGNGYTMYLDGTVKIRTVPSGAVKNIVFLKGYEGNITTSVTMGMSLKEIAEAEPDYDMGSVNKGYLGYRHSEYYLFFYNDEVSVYTYSYKRNKEFEELLANYIESKDLDAFVKGLSNRWKAYDSFEYDADIKKASILYSTRGVDIDIENNDPTGITLYSNYYFTDYTKALVKNGIVSFNGNTDLVEKIEIERRNNN